MSSEIEVKNAKIAKTMLGYEDHGILTCYLFLDYGDSTSQGFGGYSLDAFSEELDMRVPHKACGLFIKRILDTVGVEKWEQVAGQYIRVKINKQAKEGWGGKIVAVGHVMKEEWFEPERELLELTN